MFGTNPIRKQELSGLLAVQEVFYTIQGEGPFAGTPALFIRLAGCHLACSFCDTEFEQGMDKRKQTAEDVAAQAWAAVRPAAPGLVVITGGEPMRQNIVPLVDALRAWGFTHVQLETAGNFWDDALTFAVSSGYLTLVCSPKTAHVHQSVRDLCDHWKYVLRADDSDDEDGLPYKPTQAHQSPTARNIARPPQRNTVQVWLSPCDEHEPGRNARNLEAAVKLSMRHGYRLNLQIHKLIGMP